MALSRDLEIYKAADALFQFALKLQVQIPRAHRISIGLPLSTACGAILLGVSRANVSRGPVREGHIEQVIEQLESAMSFFRACHQMQILTHKVWAASIELTDSVGKQANGWLKATHIQTGTAAA